MNQKAVFICIFLQTVYFKEYNTELNLSTQSGGFWAAELGKKLYSVSTTATGLEALKQAYKENNAEVKPVDGQKLVKKMGEDIVSMLKNKVKAVERLAEVAQKAASSSVYDPHINASDFLYYNAKKINNYKANNSSALQNDNMELGLYRNAHFNDLEVNTTVSVVHVPTNVYDESANVMNGVNWSLALEDVFRSNYEKDPTLTWQYFGSSTGFLRVFPGMKWKYNDIDLYDCRSKGWYIQAATSPKDVVILVDFSGSMLGQRIEIAMRTVEKILETLSDNDFFNIILFKEEPEYVDSCFNRTLVQATEKNKLRLREKLKNLTKEEVKNIAYVDKALVAAFELLSMANASGDGALCNKAIMLITDGSPEMYEDVFKEWNWPDKAVRMFTYLIGREVSSMKEVKWMACSNKGYYTHISTLADVQENVQKYVNVTSRPLVIGRAKHTIWTSVYLDSARLDVDKPNIRQSTKEWIRNPKGAGLQLMTSVAQPVYDIRPETLEEGNLLGVVGTDVPIEEMKKLTPNYKLGVNGYAFAITNNGYVLFHPEFRPTTHDEKTKPHYNNVDLTEVEFSEHANKSSDDFFFMDYMYNNVSYANEELRKLMVDGGPPGNMTMDVKVAHDDRKPNELVNDFYRRVDIRRNEYYYYQLKDTPFTLGIALPQKYGKSQVEGMVDFKDYDPVLLEMGGVRLSDWRYCNFTNEESGMPRLDRLHRYLMEAKEGNETVKRLCHEGLLKSLIFDFNVTKTLLKSWQNISGVVQVWAGTKSGVSRGKAFDDQLNPPFYFDHFRETIKETYYKRAAEAGDGKVVFSVPIRTNDSDMDSYVGMGYDENSTVITGTTGVFLTSNGRTAMAGAVGLELRYSTVYKWMMEESQKCPVENNNKCTFTCSSEKVNCYLLDNNGFVVVSEDFNEVGRFFGEVDGSVMMEFREKKIFKRVKVFDYQAICDAKPANPSAASYLLNPLASLFRTIYWGVQELALFLIQFSLYNIWNDYTYVKATTITPSPPERVLCTNSSNLYLADPSVIAPDNSINDIMTHCILCQKSYTMHTVPYTNLFLLQLDMECTSSCGSETLSNAPSEYFQFPDAEVDRCSHYNASVYRRRPTLPCYSRDARESNSTELCGSFASKTSFSMGLIILLNTCIFATYLL